MPMPPSASDPAPKESATKARKQTRGDSKARKAATGEQASASGATRSRGDSGAVQRPQRYVPEEFDRGTDSSPRVKPFMSESGRAGMGMRF